MTTRRKAIQQLMGVAGVAAASAPFAMADKQPHMEAALGALKTAHAELRAAAADKGGHRGNAMRLVKQAMNEVQAGIDYAALKPSPPPAPQE